MHRDLAAALQALARKELPVRPGDLVCFKLSGNKLFVVQCDEQAPDPDGVALAPGQNIGGLMSTTKGTCEVVTIWLNWSGYASHWTIHRPV